MGTKFSVLQSSWAISRWGADFRSQRLIFYIALLTMIDPDRRRALRQMMSDTLEAASVGGNIEIALRPVQTEPEKEIPFKLRTHNRADYQSLVECLGSMYKTPSMPIRYVLDAGANIGLFSIGAAGRLSQIEELIMVEPNISNVPLLRFNTDSLSNKTLMPVALSGHSGEAYFESRRANNGRLVLGTPTENTTDFTRIKSKRIEEIIPSQWDMSQTWLKIDIEGAEYDVFKDLLASALRPAAISAELHDYFGANGKPLVQSLIDAGYEVSVDGSGEAGYVCRQINAELSSLS